MEAVKTYGIALNYADPELTKDKELVMEAVKQDWRALECADLDRARAHRSARRAAEARGLAEDRGRLLAHRRRRRHGRGARRPRCVGPPRELRTPSSEAAADQSCDQSSKARRGSESTILTSRQYGRVSNMDESTIFAGYDSLLPMRTAPISICTCSLEDSSSRCASIRIYMHDLLAACAHDLLLWAVGAAWALHVRMHLVL